MANLFRTLTLLFVPRPKKMKAKSIDMDLRIFPIFVYFENFVNIAAVLSISGLHNPISGSCLKSLPRHHSTHFLHRLQLPQPRGLYSDTNFKLQYLQFQTILFLKLKTLNNYILKNSFFIRKL